MKIFNNFLFEIKYLYNQKLRIKRSLPSKQEHSDLYLCSYPKSGNTWLSFIIANVNAQMSKKNLEINFFNLHQYIPDVHAHKKIDKSLLSFPGYRIIKSHSEFNPNYKFIIYLVRNPIHTMVSYFHYQKNFFDEKLDISNFIRSKKYGIDKWLLHVNGWINHPPDVSFKIIKYEDLKSDPHQTIHKLYKNLGFQIPENIIKQAIDSSNFMKMKEMEKEYYGIFSKYKNVQFVRQKNSSLSELELNDNDRNFIKKKTNELMKKLNYI